MRTLVTFRAAGFNSSVPKDYYINPGCFGDDVANWIMQELRAMGVQCVGEARQEDYGWYFTFRIDNADHQLILGFRPNDAGCEGNWVAWLERKRGFVASLLVGRRRGIQPAAVRAIHSILSASRQIQDVRWHVQADFDSGRESSGCAEP